jgi:hypothetical protein
MNRIVLSSLILSILSIPVESSNASLETHTEQLLSFHGELHRQLAEDLFAKTVDDHADGVLARQPSLAEVEDLIFTYL